MSVIDHYLEGVSLAQRTELERIRKIVKEIVPEAEELISYGMPAFKYKKKYLIGFNAFKNHLSIFPTVAPIEALRYKLKGFVLSKGTIQFTLDNPLSESTIKELIEVRLNQILVK